MQSDTEVQIIFKGTLKQWKKLCRKSRRYYGTAADENSSTSFIISCSDGDYTYDREENAYTEKVETEVQEETASEEAALENTAEESASADSGYSYAMFSSVTFRYASGNGRLVYNINVNEDGSFEGNCDYIESYSYNGVPDGTFAHFYGQFGSLEYVNDSAYRTTIVSFIVDTPTGTDTYVGSDRIEYIYPSAIDLGDEIMLYLPSASGQVLQGLSQYGYSAADGSPDPGTPIGTYAFVDVTHSWGFEGRERTVISTSWTGW